MKKLVTFLILVGVVLSYIVSIDACSRYGPDGRECKECISGFQLLNKNCYPNVKGCTEYSAEGMCAKCEPKTILVNNHCCDSGCFDKYMKKSTPSTPTYTVEQNTEHFSKMIEKAGNELPDDIAASLVWADVKIFNQVERWFFLYKIQNSHYQRIIVDFSSNFNNLENSVVDSSLARIPEEFDVVQWKEVDNNEAVLALFPALYPQGRKYTQVFAKIAVLSEIRQFQIVTVFEGQTTIRVLYQRGQQQVVLRETVSSIKFNDDARLSLLRTEAPSTSAPLNTLKTIQPQKPSLQSASEDKSTTHTTFSAPFSNEIRDLAEKLEKIKEKSVMKAAGIKTSSTPLIGAPTTLFPRRIVATALCGGQRAREIAVVQGDGYSTKEYFDYYLEYPDIFGDPQWYFLGNKTKIQPTSIFNNPSAYPITIVDPSFVVYPNAILYYQRGILDMYRSYLSPDLYSLEISITVDPKTEQDRMMGKVSRFAIDGVVSTNNIKAKKVAWQISQIPDGFQGTDPMVSDVCTVALISESYVIGTSGDQNLKTEQLPQNTPQLSFGITDQRKLVYTGINIDAELDVNQPLVAAVDLLKSSSGWNYQLKEVQEILKSSDIVEFVILAQNSDTTVKSVVQYSRSEAKAKLISADDRTKVDNKTVTKEAPKGSQ